MSVGSPFQNRVGAFCILLSWIPRSEIALGGSAQDAVGAKKLGLVARLARFNVVLSKIMFALCTHSPEFVEGNEINREKGVATSVPVAQKSKVAESGRVGKKKSSFSPIFVWTR